MKYLLKIDYCVFVKKEICNEIEYFSVMYAQC